MVVAGFQATVAIGFGVDAVALFDNAAVAVGVDESDDEVDAMELILTSTSTGLTSTGEA